MTVQYRLDYGDFSRLSPNLARLGDKAEKTLNKSLEKHTERLIVPLITNLIPDSSWKNRGLTDKVHAKETEWHKIDMGNLEATIKSKGGAANKKGSFGYLVFPDEGRGPHNRIEQRFMEKGMEQGTPALVDAIQEDLLRVIEEEL
jgi:hypothetical protein